MRIFAPLEYPRSTGDIQFQQFISCNNTDLLKTISQCRMNLVSASNGPFAACVHVSSSALVYIAHLQPLMAAIENPKIASHAVGFFGFKQAQLPVISWKTTFGSDEYVVKFPSIESVIAFELSVAFYILGASLVNQAFFSLAPVVSASASPIEIESACNTACGLCCQAAGVFQYTVNNQPSHLARLLVKSTNSDSSHAFPEACPVVLKALQDYSMMCAQACAVEIARVKNLNPTLMSKLTKMVVEQGQAASSVLSGDKKKYPLRPGIPSNFNVLLSLHLSAVIPTYNAWAYLEYARSFYNAQKYGYAAGAAKIFLAQEEVFVKLCKEVSPQWILTVSNRTFGLNPTGTSKAPPPPKLSIWGEIISDNDASADTVLTGTEECRKIIKDNDCIYFESVPVTSLDPIYGQSVKQPTPFTLPPDAYDYTFLKSAPGTPLPSRNSSSAPPAPPPSIPAQPTIVSDKPDDLNTTDSFKQEGYPTDIPPSAPSAPPM